MNSRILFGPILVVTGLLAVAVLSVGTVANAGSPERSFLKSGKSARSNVIELRRRVRRRIHLPIGPSYVYYDYPYYYSRGYYPTHITSYVYYPYSYYSGYYTRHSKSPRRHRARRN